MTARSAKCARCGHRFEAHGESGWPCVDCQHSGRTAGACRGFLERPRLSRRQFLASLAGVIGALASGAPLVGGAQVVQQAGGLRLYDREFETGIHEGLSHFAGNRLGKPQTRLRSFRRWPRSAWPGGGAPRET